MRRVALLSDVHGNHRALEACLADLSDFSVDRVFNLGDVFGYGPEPDHCLEILLEVCDASLLGNHDNYLVNSMRCPRSQSANIALDIQRSRVRPSSLEALRTLPLSIDFESPDVRLRHGGWQDPLEEYVCPSPQYFRGRPGGAYFSGHTHLATIRDYGRVFYCNPGSVGQPRDGDWRSSYALVDLEARSAVIRRIPYDVDGVKADMKNLGFPYWNYRNLSVGISI